MAEGPRYGTRALVGGRCQGTQCPGWEEAPRWFGGTSTEKKPINLWLGRETRYFLWALPKNGVEVFFPALSSSDCSEMFWRPLSQVVKRLIARHRIREVWLWLLICPPQLAEPVHELTVYHLSNNFLFWGRWDHETPSMRGRRLAESKERISLEVS